MHWLCFLLLYKFWWPDDDDGLVCSSPVYVQFSLIPRPLPDFISHPWRKIGRKAWDQNYTTDLKWWTQFVLTKSTISGPWRSFDPMQAFSRFVSCEIKSGSGLGMRLCSITVHSYTDEYGIVSQCGTECMQFSGYIVMIVMYMWHSWNWETSIIVKSQYQCLLTQFWTLEVSTVLVPKLKTIKHCTKINSFQTTPQVERILYWPPFASSPASLE